MDGLDDGAHTDALFLDVEAFDETWSPWPEAPEIADDGGIVTPPPPEPPRRRPGGGGAPHPDRAAVNPWMTLAIVALFVASGALQLLTISAGARGGLAAAYALSAAFGVLFLGPFVVGALWLGRQRRS
ncbi:MAG: hypothetical protein H6732_19815 [Alphaproteobacteria bacterium]|nr:hypothetical protein [Alphaproteobacteria bacterium]